MSDSQGQTQAEGQTADAMPTSQQPGEAQLPEEVSERTAAEFEKLKQHNKVLSQRLAEVTKAQSLLDDLPSNEQVLPTEASANTNNFVDSNGYVDTVLLNNQLALSQRKAEEAVKKAQDAEKRIQEFEKTQLVREAHAKYPQLDPNSDTFDPVFYDAVKNELVGQLSRGKRDIIAAAKKVETFYTRKQVSSKDTQAEKEKIVTSRQQASTQTGTTQGARVPVNHEQLVAGTRRGDPEAIFKRLQAAGI
jgi:hypothetical protein